MITAIGVAPNFIVVEDILTYIPEEHSKTLEDVDWGNTSFTTFSICDTGMLEYEITTDGFFYVTKEDGSLEKLDYTGEIEFSALIPSSDKDYELYFKALFFKGDLKNLNFEKMDELDSSSREEAKEKIMGMIKAREERANKWWYKFYVFYIKCVIFVFSLIRWVLGGIIKLCWLIQNKIT